MSFSESRHRHNESPKGCYKVFDATLHVFACMNMKELAKLIHLKAQAIGPLRGEIPLPGEMARSAKRVGAPKRKRVTRRRLLPVLNI